MRRNKRAVRIKLIIPIVIQPVNTATADIDLDNLEVNICDHASFVPCIASCKDGSPCTFPRLPGASYCFVHDQRPETVRRRYKDRARGGKMHRQYVPDHLEGAKLETVEEFRGFAFRVTRELQTGRLDVKSANALLFACRVALRAAESARRKTEPEERSKLPPLEFEVAPLWNLVDDGRSGSIKLRALDRLGGIMVAAATACEAQQQARGRVYDPFVRCP